MRRVFVSLLAAVGLLACSGRQESRIEIRGDADLAGLRVATLAGSCYDLELSARKDISLQLYYTDSDVLQALLNGKADVAVHDETVYNARVRQEFGVRVAYVGEQAFPTAFLFRKDAEELAGTLSAVQRRMEADGSMQRLKDFWLTDKCLQADSLPPVPDEPAGEPLRVATGTTSEPISFEVDGQWYGIEIDILRELGRELHRPLEIKLYDSSNAMMAVSSGVADVLCGCIFVTPEREEEFLFSEPYHSYHPAYFVLDREKVRAREGFLPGLRESVWKNLVKENRWKFIVRGLWETVKISLLAILLGSVLGIGLYAMTRSRRRWVRSFASVYHGFMAGIPELVLLLILFYVVFAGTRVPADWVAVLSFALLFASDASDVYGASLDAVPRVSARKSLPLR